MVRTRNVAIAAMLISLISQSAAAQLGSSCVTRREAETIITFALPSMVKTVARQCAPHISGVAALSQSGTLIAARYQPQSDQAWEAAAVAIDKMMGLPIAKGMGAERATIFLAPLLSREMAKSIQPENCDAANRFIDALQPLPARNVAALLMVIAQSAAERKPEAMPIKICAQQAKQP
jgi:hypothetical protein